MDERGIDAGVVAAEHVQPAVGPAADGMGEVFAARLHRADQFGGPVGAAVFPHELQRPTRREAEQRFTDLRYWSEPEVGGHFAAWEQPAVFAAEVERFFAVVR